MDDGPLTLGSDAGGIDRTGQAARPGRAQHRPARRGGASITPTVEWVMPPASGSAVDALYDSLGSVRRAGHAAWSRWADVVHIGEWCRAAATLTRLRADQVALGGAT